MSNTEDYNKKIEANLSKAIKSEEKSFFGFFIKRFRFTYLIIFTILALGTFTIITIPREAEPEIRVPFAVVTTVYPGATPLDIEDSITNKIEDEIKDLENLNKFSSNSGQGFSSIFVEFNAEADLKESFRKLKEKVDEAKAELPQETETPIVTEVNFNDIPIVTYSLSGNYPKTDLKKFADKLQIELENISDVSKAPIIGSDEQEFQIIVDPNKLITYNITLGQIVNAIQVSHFNLPVGNIEIDGFKYNVRVEGKFSEADKLNDIVVATFNNSPVLIRDLALVKDGFKERTSESKIGKQGEESKPTISLQLFKKTGGNILDIIKEAEEIVANAHSNKIIPNNVSIIKTNDNSKYIKKDLKTFGKSGIQTFSLIMLILYIVLSFRGAIITASSIPLAFLSSFIFLNMLGMTINSMTLFALVLSLGLMVDNAIVIIEGINEYTEKHDKPIYEASILSVWNFKWPIIAGTMTTVSAFLPMLLVSGIMGEYIGILPKTISITLLSSLFMSLIIIPTLSARFIKTNKSKGESHRNKKRHEIINREMAKLKKVYTKYLKIILPNKSKRRRFLAVIWILFIAAIAVPTLGIMRVEMFPKIDFEYFYANIELPIGSTLEKTSQITKEVENIITQVPEVENFVVNIGSSMSLGPGGGSSNETHLANIAINLKDEKLRERKSFDVAEDLRNQIKKIQNAIVTIDEMNAGPPSGAPIEVRIFGNLSNETAIVADEIKEYFKNIPGLVNIKDSLENATGDFTFTIDKQKANYYGLSTLTIASTLRNAIHGTKAGIVNINDNDIDITVKYSDDNFNNTNDLKNILIPTNTRDNIPLKEVANLELKPSLLSIKHRDGNAIVTVTAEVEKSINITKVISEFEKEIKTSPSLLAMIDKGVQIDIGGETEDIEKSFTELFSSLLIAIGLIIIILVLQFNSFKQPFIIIFTLPLALIGVILGLTILRQPFSITSFIGIVSLTGIVVNDSIVLIDRINKNIKNGMDFFESIIDGGLSRMQPIFVTSITTIAGIFPLIFASEMWIGLSLTIICGLSFSTILTLVVIPVYYASICKNECLKN